LDKTTYQRIEEASENAMQHSCQRAMKELKALSPIARAIVRAYRKKDTVWERKSRLLMLPKPLSEDVASVLRFFSEFPWWRREPYSLRPAGRPRELTDKDRGQALAMISDLLEDGYGVTFAVEQAAARFLVSERTMWSAYRPKQPRNDHRGPRGL